MVFSCHECPILYPWNVQAYYKGLMVTQIWGVNPSIVQMMAEVSSKRCMVIVIDTYNLASQHKFFPSSHVEVPVQRTPS